jgi:hypothetical protein
MAKDLTTSAIERQNVLNNNLAIPRIREALDVEAYLFEGKYYLTKQMVADFYDVDIRTIERYLETNKDELERNGFFLCKGKRLKEFKLQFAPDNNVGHKTVALGLFDFRAFLNIGMLLAESEKAKREGAWFCQKRPLLSLVGGETHIYGFCILHWPLFCRRQQAHFLSTGCPFPNQK